jgi:lysophospholipase L1-like esterase
MARILVFGDSITYGAWDRGKEGGWVHRLKKFLDDKYLTDHNFDYPTYNLGISGDTTKDLLERFEFETKQRLKDDEVKVIIFQIGLNDSQWVLNQNNFRVPPENFKENIQKLINIAKKLSSKIVFLGLTPVEDQKVNPIPWAPEKSYKIEDIQKYNKIIKTVCQETNVPFIEIFEKWQKLDYKILLEDGAHPNSEGHKKIFEIVKDFLIQNKII